MITTFKAGDLVVPRDKTSSYIRNNFKLGIVIKMLDGMPDDVIRYVRVYWLYRGRNETMDYKHFKRINPRHKK